MGPSCWKYPHTYTQTAGTPRNQSSWLVRRWWGGEVMPMSEGGLIINCHSQQQLLNEHVHSYVASRHVQTHWDTVRKTSEQIYEAGLILLFPIQDGHIDNWLEGPWGRAAQCGVIEMQTFAAHIHIHTPTHWECLITKIVRLCYVGALVWKEIRAVRRHFLSSKCSF